MNFVERRSLEYTALQAEILENFKNVYQIISGTVALSAGLTGYCFSTAQFPNLLG